MNDFFPLNMDTLNRHKIGLRLFLFSLLIGFYLVSDHGLPIDEISQRDLGIAT